MSEILVKKEAETNPEWGKDPYERSISELLECSLINLDKPRGPTSHQVCYWIKKILGVNKVGHGGTLDPKVTGVLPVGVNKGTKVLQAFLYGRKTYVALMHVHSDFKEEKLFKTIKKFEGPIIQVPPLKSAVKRRPRRKWVYKIKVLEVDGRDVLLEIECEAGVYIRKLIWDMGKEMGTRAHMQELRRIRSGPFSEEDSVILQDIADAFMVWKETGNEKYLRKILLPIEAGVEHLKKIWVLDSCVDAICHGASLKAPGVAKLSSDIQPDDFVAIMTLKNELIGFGRALMNSQEILEKKRGIVAKIERVIMERGRYPPLWKKSKF